MKKKQSYIEKLFSVPILLLVLIIIILSLFLAYINTDTQWCKNNPSLCVCEEWEEIGWHKKYNRKEDVKPCDKVIEYPLHYDCMNCKSYRKMTECELNPNDEEKCFCMEKENDEEIAMLKEIVKKDQRQVFFKQLIAF